MSTGQPDSTAQPDKAQPGKAQPGKAQPDKAQPDKAQPDKAQPGKAQPGEAQPGKASAAPRDLTARARIREAAIRHFADEGYERSTIRGIAVTAGVSPGLLRHHFGSKEELRRACDEHVAQTMRRINAQYLDDLGGAATDRSLLQPFERYIVRALAENSPSAAAIFDELVTMTEQWLKRADAARQDPPAVDRRIRAALISAMASGIPLLHEQLSRAVGADIFGAAGGRLVALGLLDIYSHPLISAEDAAAGETGLD
jgi:AcrR family transcriptional regulator